MSALTGFEQAERAEFRGQTFEIGQQIAYDVQVWGKGADHSLRERHEGVITEVWANDGSHATWPNHVYLEVDGVNGAERVWAHRDDIGEPGTLGQATDGALF